MIHSAIGGGDKCFIIYLRALVNSMATNALALFVDAVQRFQVPGERRLGRRERVNSRLDEISSTRS